MREINKGSDLSASLDEINYVEYWLEKARDLQLDGDLLLAPNQRARLNNEVADLGRIAFGSAAPERTTTIRDQLQKLATLLRKTETALQNLPQNAWYYAAIEDPGHTLKYIGDLSDRFRGGGNLAAEDADKSGESGGGPNREKRLNRFVYMLKKIFESYYFDTPTHVDQKDENSAPPSRFDRFVYKIYGSYLPAEETPKWPVLNRAIKEALITNFDDSAKGKSVEKN